MSEEIETVEILDEDIVIIKNEVESGLLYRERKHEDWTENYTLYRDKVITNRLTQRQTINIPLMKYVLNTQLKEMMDPPQLYFSNLDNNEQKEIFYNEHWKEVYRLNKLVIRDHVDKKQNALFGRSFKKITVEDGKLHISLVDPQDIIIHRFVDPQDIDSAPCLIETGIYETLRSIVDNEEYDESERKRLEMYFSEESNELEKDDNFERASEKSDRLKVIGVTDADDPMVGETYIELYQVFRFENSEDLNKNLIFRYVVANTEGGMFKLHKEELHNIIGETSDDFWHNHFPYTSWASDPESTDFWNDSVADVVRPINKVVNVWISQLVENRTLQNFGMKYYDSSNKDFIPQTFAPQPWAHFPVPGDPNKLIKDVVTGNLVGNLDEITFLMSIAEKATASTAANTGSVEQKKVTLGEVELALANAQKRILVQQVFYTEDWKDLGLKVSKFIEAVGDSLDPVTIYKKGRFGKRTYKKELSPKDWSSKEGYAVEVKTVTDKQQETVDSLQKLNVLKTEMPGNVPLVTIYQHKLMEFSGLSPDEISQVEEFEKQNIPVVDDFANVEAVSEPNAGTQQNASQIPDIPDIAQ